MEIIGRKFETTTSGSYDAEKKIWNIVLTATEYTSTDGENWDSETLTFEAYSPDYDEGLKETLRDYMAWMQIYAHNRGITGIIEAVRTPMEEDPGDEKALLN